MAAPTDLNRVISSAVRRPSAAAAKRRQIGRDLRPGDDGARQADRHVSAFRASGLGVDEDAGAPQGLVVGFAHGHREGADEVEMLSGFQPSALDERRCRERGA